MLLRLFVSAMGNIMGMKNVFYEDVNMNKENIKTSDWLTRDIPKEQLARERREALLSAYLELCIAYDEETKRIDFDATAEKMVAEGYCKKTDVAKEIFEKLYTNIKFDGHTVSIWKNDLIETAKEYGISLE